MIPWAEKYAHFTQKTLGILVPSDLKQTKLHSAYPQDSVWFQRCLDGLLKVEVEYTQELINDINRRSVPGAFVEFGIYQGHWIKLLFEMTERANLSDREVWGFDSFKGLSKPHSTSDTSFWEEGMYSASRAEVEKNVNTAERPRIKLVEGFFSDSLKAKEATTLGDVAYARIDCDIYEPSLECLQFLSHRLSHGAVLVFDDWTHDINFGEAKAFAEWVPSVSHLRFEFLCIGPWDHLYLRVWHKERTPTEEDDQITNLNLGFKDGTTTEWDDQMTALNQAIPAVASRDGQIASLNQTLAERKQSPPYRKFRLIGSQ